MDGGMGNCYYAKFIGCFDDMKQSRMVLLLASMSNTIKNNRETVTIHPVTIFQITLKSKYNDLTYDRTLFPLALLSEDERK